MTAFTHGAFSNFGGKNTEERKFIMKEFFNVYAQYRLQKCVSCGGPSKNDFCEFCLNEE